MAVLAESLGQDGPQRAVGIDDQNPMGLNGLGRGCGLGLLVHHLSKLIGIGWPNAYQAMPCHLARIEPSQDGTPSVRMGRGFFRL